MAIISQSSVSLKRDFQRFAPETRPLQYAVYVPMFGQRRLLQASIFTAEVRNTGPGSVVLSVGTGGATVLTPNTSAYVQLAEGEVLDAQSQGEQAVLIVSADERVQGKFVLRLGDEIDVSDEDEKQYMRGAYAWRAKEVATNEFEGVQVFDGTTYAYAATDSPDEIEYDDVLQNHTFIGTTSNGIKRFDPINGSESVLDAGVTDTANAILPLRTPVLNRYIFNMATDDVILYDDTFTQVSLENIASVTGPDQFRDSAVPEYVTFGNQFADELYIIRLTDGESTTVSFSSDYTNAFRTITLGFFHYILSDNDEKCLAVDLRTGDSDEIFFATGPANSVGAGNDTTGAWELDYDIPGEQILFFPHINEYMRVPDTGFATVPELGLNIDADGAGGITISDIYGGRLIASVDLGFVDFVGIDDYDLLSRHIMFTDGGATGDPVSAFPFDIVYDYDA